MTDTKPMMGVAKCEGYLENSNPKNKTLFHSVSAGDYLKTSCLLV